MAIPASTHPPHGHDRKTRPSHEPTGGGVKTGDRSRPHPSRHPFVATAATCAAVGLIATAGCGGRSLVAADAGTRAPVVHSATARPNAVTTWSEVAAATVNGTGTATVTPEEQRPNYLLDLPTVHLAIYDAVMAITGTHRPYASALQAPQSGASQEAAVAAAAYRVLQVLFPSRGALYQGAYDRALAAIADGEAKAHGLAIGIAAADAVLNLRRNDGRAVALAAFVPGTAPGQFRTANAAGVANPYLSTVRPFALHHVAQFRPAGPPALTSAAYESAFNETKSLGGTASTTRTAEQTDTARFHTEPPPRFAPRNLLPFASNQATLGDAARVMALLWVAQADALIACFEAKYHYRAWRPMSAIALADTDGNPNTAPDAAWTPVVPTPNHPEYPAAHACFAGAVAEAVNAFHGTPQVSFIFDSQAAGVANPRHTYASTGAMVEELQMARIWGGMHFRHANEDGAALGRTVARWVVSQRFQPR